MPIIKLASTITLILVLYVAGYGFARWQKLMVRTGGDVALVESGWQDTSIEAGDDPDSSPIAAVKNIVSLPVAYFYTPLRWVESDYWDRKLVSRREYHLRNRTGLLPESSGDTLATEN